MAEALFLCQRIGASSYIDGVHTILINSDDAGIQQATASIGFQQNPAAGNSLQIENTTYTFVSVLADANDVLIGVDFDATAANLVAAINGDAGEGTTYGTGTVANSDVTVAYSSPNLTFTAIADGSFGNNEEFFFSEDNIFIATVDRMSGGTPDREAEADLQFTSGAPTNGETLQIGSITYTFVDTLVNAYDVLIGTETETIVALNNAIVGSTSAQGSTVGNGTVAHPDVTAANVADILTLTNLVAGYDTDRLDADGSFKSVGTVLISTTAAMSITSVRGARTAGGTLSDTGSEASAACNRAFGVDIFPDNYFNSFTQVDDLTSGPLAADQSGYIFSGNADATFASGV